MNVQNRMTVDLHDLVVLVTGGSGGIGSAICREFARRGCRVAIHYFRGKEKALLLKQAMQEAGVHAEMFEADLRSRTDAERLIDDVMRTFNRLDILINNSGWSARVPPHDLDGLTEEVIQETILLKINAVIYTTRAAAPHLKKSKLANVINITSAAGVAARGSSIVYAAANAALYSLTKSFARILSPEVRVNAVAPGFVETGFVFPADGKMAHAVKQTNYTGDVVRADEVARVAAFLCMDTPSITGEEIVVDGGIARLWKK